jgi:transposase
MSVLMASRKMYNACLEELITHYKETGTYLHLYEQDKRHGKEAHPDLPAVVVDTTLKRLHRSFTNFFSGLKEGRKVGFPRFKSANAWNTIQFRDVANCLDNGRFKAKKGAKKLARAQRTLAKCKKGSHRRKKAKRVVARMHERIANQRKEHFTGRDARAGPDGAFVERARGASASW